MEISVTQENLQKALLATSRVASTKAGLPVLGNVLLRTEDNRLLVAATNLEIASTILIGAKVVTRGAITVPAKLISEFVANLPKGNVELKVTKSRLTINSGGYSSTINGIDADEFPELPAIDEKTSIHYSLNAADFKHAVSQTIFACSTDTSRPVLTGVYWHSYDGKLYLVGTDGYRLAERVVVDTKSDLAAIVPVSTLQEVLRVVSDNTPEIDILFDETQVRFRVDDTEITSRLIDGKYPDYRQLIPKSTDINTSMATADLSRTAKIARLFAQDSGGSIMIVVDEADKMFDVRSVASEVGENTSRIDATVSGSGQVSLNSRYLSEALAVIEDTTLNLGFSGKLSPIVLTPGGKDANYLHIIMPLKS